MTDQTDTRIEKFKEMVPWVKECNKYYSYSLPQCFNYYKVNTDTGQAIDIVTCDAQQLWLVIPSCSQM